MTLAGVLQGLGDVKRLLVNNAVSGCVLLIGVALLVPLPGVGMYGAALATDLAWLCGFLLHLAALRRHLALSLPWGRIAGAPLLALAAAGGAWLAAAEISGELSASGSGLIGVGAAAIAYLLTLYWRRGRLSL